jgi:hypothetical protein
MGSRKAETRSGVAVLADGLDRAAFEGFAAERDFFLRGRLLVDEGVAALVVAREEIGGGLAAEIAVDALLVDVELARDVMFPLVGFVGHNSCGAKAGVFHCQETSSERRIFAKMRAQVLAGAKRMASRPEFREIPRECRDRPLSSHSSRLDSRHDAVRSFLYAR